MIQSVVEVAKTITVVVCLDVLCLMHGNSVTKIGLSLSNSSYIGYVVFSDAGCNSNSFYSPRDGGQLEGSRETLVALGVVVLKGHLGKPKVNKSNRRGEYVGKGYAG